MRLFSPLVLLLLALACNEPPKAQQAPNEPSPNASILPAPLASALEPVAKAAASDSSRALDPTLDAKKIAVHPQALREDHVLLPDSALRETQGLRLYAEFRWLDLPAFPRHPETNPEAREQLRASSDFSLVIDLFQAGRMRVVVDSELFVMPKGSELRARDDYLGHLLVFDGERAYTPILPGALRALFTEGRADAAPLTKPKITELGTSGFLGFVTHKRELKTALGRVVLEQTSSTNTGVGGNLLCRMLSELVAADPTNAACGRRELPLRAEIFSSGGGHLLFETRRIDREASIDQQGALVPPLEARFAADGLSELGGAAFTQKPEFLQRLRNRPVARTERPDPLAPKQGLTIVNRTESLRYVLLDGLILGRVPPRREIHVEALLPGKYSVMSLDFLGDDPTPMRALDVPARLQIGEIIEVDEL